MAAEERSQAGDFLHVPPSFSSPIPPELYSTYEEGPFTVCTVCDAVLEEKNLYEIQKVFRGKECIFEMAVCHACGEAVAQEFSEESLEAMKGFLLCHFQANFDPESNHCHFCGMPRGVLPGVTVVGACRSRSLIFPCLVMCEKCGDHLNGQLSQRTRDVQGDFIRDHFPGVPADMDLSPSFSGLM